VMRIRNTDYKILRNIPGPVLGYHLMKSFSNGKM
jgi:hypothetical protein